MISIAPYYRKERKAVILRVFVDGQIAKVINTGIKVESDQWDEKERKVKKHPNQKVFNQKIQNKVSELQREITKADILGVVLTKDRVKSLSEGHAVTTDFYKHCSRWLEEKYKNKDTRKGMIADLNKIHAYAPSLQFGDIDVRWLYRYEKYLKEKLDQDGNTLWKAMKFIRTMLYDAQSIGGIVERNPFQTKEYRAPRYVQPEKDGLYIAELDLLEKILEDKNQPVIIKIMTAKFLFMCYTGLRISDAKLFSFDDHLIEGERVVVTSKKTQVTTNLKVYKRLENVLRHLKELPSKAISDQKFNVYLKAIQGTAGITRINITSHVARHTMGCLLAELNIPIEVAQKIMGHKNRKTTEIYYHLRQANVDTHSDRLNNV